MNNNHCQGCEGTGQSSDGLRMFVCLVCNGSGRTVIPDAVRLDKAPSPVRPPAKADSIDTFEFRSLLPPLFPDLRRWADLVTYIDARIAAAYERGFAAGRNDTNIELLDTIIHLRATLKRMKAERPC